MELMLMPAGSRQSLLPKDWRVLQTRPLTPGQVIGYVVDLQCEVFSYLCPSTYVLQPR